MVSLSSTPATVGELLDQANQLYAEANDALTSSPPDFATYSEKIQQAFELVAKAEELSGGGPPTTEGGVVTTEPPTSST
jgi:hypothetical protein